jgi:hypothetical protein
MSKKKPAHSITSFINKPSLGKLQERYQQARSTLQKKNKDLYEWLETSFSSEHELTEFAKQFLTVMAISGQMLLSQPVEAQVQQNLAAIKQEQRQKNLKEVTQEEMDEILEKMVNFVNQEAGHLAQQDQLYLEQQLTDLLGFEVAVELEGNQLNHSIGIMGGEQHLMRYPGDVLANHDAYQGAGIAPNRGAYSWFIQEGELTEQAIAREKYYFAVQTMYLPNWNTSHSALKEWYKFRKMIAVNPTDRLAVVGVVADAGPAMWVKKQFGGSPEVIRETKIWSPKARGRVMLMFVNDPDNKVPLGVINLDEIMHTINNV